MIPRLNLGCGFNYLEDYWNIDIDDKQFKIDQKIDLEMATLPYKDNSIEIIRACHILEHINNFIPLMKEIWRVLKIGGVLYIRVPNASCRAAYADPTHVRFFVPESFHLWTDNRPGGADTGNIGHLFELGWIELLVHDRGKYDLGNIGSWFTEIECELIKQDRTKNEKKGINI